MRKFIDTIITLGIIATCMISCTPEDNAPERYTDPALVGEWHLTEASSEGTDISKEVDVYMILNQDGTFELYQKSTSQQLRYDKFTGTWYCIGNTLMGEYSDGNAWGASYAPEIHGDKLILSSIDLMEVQIYEKGSLSEQDKENAVLITNTKSGSNLISPIL